MTAAIVLAAGASTRLGEPKQLAMLGGETLLNRAVRTARDAGCNPVIVVLGANVEEIRQASELRDLIVLVNREWAEGIASSIRVGVSALGAATGVVLMTCDQPAVTPEHLRKLMESDHITASAYGGRHGVPAYFPAAWFPALAQLTGNTGARELLRDATAIELANGELDVDTDQELSRAKQLFG